MDRVNKLEYAKSHRAVSELISHMDDDMWSRCSLHKILRDSTIFESGDPLREVYILCEGTVIISSLSFEGNQERIVFVDKGQIIGEMEALAGEKNLVYNAKAYTQCEMLKISVSDFLEWIKKDKYICNVVIKVLATKLLVSAKEKSSYINFSGVMRLANFLIYETPGKISKTRLELAEICNVSARTVNRSRDQLKKEGYINLNKGKIYISKEQREILKNSKYCCSE